MTARIDEQLHNESARVRESLLRECKGRMWPAADVAEEIEIALELLHRSAHNDKAALRRDLQTVAAQSATHLESLHEYDPEDLELTQRHAKLHDHVRDTDGELYAIVQQHTTGLELQIQMTANTAIRQGREGLHDLSEADRWTPPAQSARMLSQSSSSSSSFRLMTPAASRAGSVPAAPMEMGSSYFRHAIQAPDMLQARLIAEIKHLMVSPPLMSSHDSAEPSYFPKRPPLVRR